MMVLDASAWIDMLLGDEELPPPDEHVVVPPHFDAEAVSAVRALQQRGALSALEADTALELHLAAGHESVRDASDIRQAWAWRESLSFRDGWYAALAHRLGVPWVTTDAGAMKTARRLGVDGRHPGQTRP